MTLKYCSFCRSLLRTSRNARWPHYKIPPSRIFHVQLVLWTIQCQATGAKLWLHTRRLDRQDKKHSAMDSGWFGKTLYTKRRRYPGSLWRISICKVVPHHLQWKWKALLSVQRREPDKGNMLLSSLFVFYLQYSETFKIWATLNVIKIYFFLTWLRSFNPLRPNIRIHILHTFPLQGRFFWQQGAS